MLPASDHRFQMDIADPDLRRLTREVLEWNEATVANLLREALAAGEIEGCDPEEFAPILLTVAQGSLLSWAIHRKGTARQWVAQHVDPTLRPYLSPA